MQKDGQLIEECKNGNNAAFAVLIERYDKKIFNFAYQYARNTEETEDIYQDSMFKAWKKIKTFKGGNKFLPWLYQITRNTALDHIKKRKDQTFSSLNIEKYEVGTTFEETLRDEEPLPEDIFSNNQLVSELENGLKQLQPDERAILILHYKQELTFEEISQILEKPMNTVKSWHYRAILKLRKILLHQR